MQTAVLSLERRRKWSSPKLSSVQNPVQISVHSPVHSPVHGPVQSPESSFYNDPDWKRKLIDFDPLFAWKFTSNACQVDNFRLVIVPNHSYRILEGTGR